MTVHCPLGLLYVTASPELAVAPGLKSACPYVTPLGAVNVIVCVAPVIVYVAVEPAVNW